MNSRLIYKETYMVSAAATKRLPFWQLPETVQNRLVNSLRDEVVDAA